MKMNKELLLLIVIFMNNSIYFDARAQEYEQRFIRSSGGEQLAKYRIYANKKRKNGETILMIAAAEANPFIAHLLIDKDATTINQQDNNGETALMKAAWADSIEIVMLLLARPKIRLDLTDRYGWRALDYARRRHSRRRSFSITNLLIEAERLEKNNRGNALFIDSTKRKTFFTNFLSKVLKEEGIPRKNLKNGKQDEE